MTGPAVSVVLPVHNGAPHVAEAIGSLTGQSFPDFELVICDDGSDDGTPGIVRSLADSDPRIRVERRQAKSGVASAMNWAVRQARAELVAIAHADDLSHPDRLERQVALMAGTPDCVLTGAPADALDWYGKRAHPPNLWPLTHPRAFAPFAHSSVMLRRRAFDAAGGYRSDRDYWEDLDLYWRMARQGRVLVATRPLSTYRYSRTSIRAREDAARIERALDTMYRSAARIGRGGENDPASVSRRDPRVFVARNWSKVWAGQRAKGLSRLLREGRLRFDRASAESLAFMTWAAIAPKSLRASLRLFVALRNRVVLRALADRQAVEWDPHGVAR